jgi:hypothetical protein
VPGSFKISPDGSRIKIENLVDRKTIDLILNLKNGKISDWPISDVSDVAPVKSADGSITVLTRPDGLYYIDVFSKGPEKILGTAPGDIAIRLE